MVYYLVESTANYLVELLVHQMVDDWVLLMVVQLELSWVEQSARSLVVQMVAMKGDYLAEMLALKMLQLTSSGTSGCFANRNIFVRVWLKSC